MNKEAIKKYNEEFTYWLDEGKIQWQDDKGIWHDNEFVWYDKKYLFKAIIKNDAYLKFRKALANGKTLRICTGLNNYTNINSIEEYLEKYKSKGYPLSIKPDKPKFKKGDIVKVTKSGWVVLVFIIVGISDCNSYYITNSDILTKWSIDKQNYLKLQPNFKAGDWVVDTREGMKNQIVQVQENCIALTDYENYGIHYKPWKPQAGEKVVYREALWIFNSSVNLNRSDGLLTYSLSRPLDNDHITVSTDKVYPLEFIQTLKDA